MEYTELGNTGLRVSVMSLGAGGASKLGLRSGQSANEAQRVVETALDLGINTIDTAEAYGTESVVGEAIAGTPRDGLVLSTKFKLYEDGELRSASDLEQSVSESLERLNTEYIDVYHLHGVKHDDYEDAVDAYYPTLESLKEAGTIRAIGITETTSGDPSHTMLARAVTDDLWDVMMVGFNLLNHSARERVLKPAIDNGIGIIGMVAVRRALSNPDYLGNTLDTLIETGEIDPDLVDRNAPFEFLLHSDGASNIIDAAYRFARHEPGIDTVLTGTGDEAHLRSNVASALAGPLPDDDLAELDHRFGRVESNIGN